MTSLHLRKSIDQSPLRRSFSVVLLALAFPFALSPAARAVSPPPDGGYPNGNTAEGDHALFSLTTGFDNTAVGAFALQSNTSGSENTGIGGSALTSNTTGSLNTATGAGALYSNTTGAGNTANGYASLLQNTIGSNNSASGAKALLNNTTGSNNTATGFNALTSNTTGPFNTAMGESALSSNTTGDRNTAMGDGALIANSTGASNTAVGVSALRNNTTAAYNTAVGHDALVDNNGNFNTASGFQALLSNTIGHDNSAGGFQALANNRTGSSNIALGSKAGINLTTGSNNIEIGAPGVAAEANTIRIGKSGTQKKTFIAGIRGVTVASGVGVIVGTTGQLGTVLSSARFKDEIKPMDKASEAILQLKPVTFRYKQELDPDGIPQFGLVAEEVEKVNPDLVARDEEGKVNTVRYEAVNAMLLNEFLKEHGRAIAERRKVEEQAHLIQELKGLVTTQQKQIGKLTAGLQRVSDEVELAKPVSKAVASN